MSDPFVSNILQFFCKYGNANFSISLRIELSCSRQLFNCVEQQLSHVSYEMDCSRQFLKCSIYKLSINSLPITATSIAVCKVSILRPDGFLITVNWKLKVQAPLWGYLEQPSSEVVCCCPTHWVDGNSISACQAH